MSSIDDPVIDGLGSALGKCARHVDGIVGAALHERAELRGVAQMALNDLADRDDLTAMTAVALAAACLDWLDGQSLADDAAVHRVLDCWRAYLEAVAATRWGIDPAALFAD